jgi:O-antigen/teichoic acid export membrane protein
VRGVGARPVILRAGAIGGALVAGLIVIALAAHQPVTDRLFDGDGLLLLGLVVAIVCYSSYFLFRGSLAGNGRFSGYATLLAVESGVRVALSLALALAGVRSAWVFSLAIGTPCVIALVPMLLRERGLAAPGPPATWTEISSALTQLLAGSLLAQVLSNISPLAVKVIATDSGAGGRFLDNLIVARVPLFFFQAVQASLLPKLAAQAAAHHYDEFSAGLRRLLVLLVAVVGISVLGMLAVGPFIVRALFGSGYELTRLDLALLAAGSEGMMICFSLAQASIALRAYGRMVAGWAAGIVTVGILLAVLHGVERRAEVAFLLGVATGSIALGAALLSRLRSLARSGA